MTGEDIALTIATVCTALMAGTFYVFAIAVCPALARNKDSEYVAVMQSINVTIVNPLFLSAFLGAPVALVTATALQSDATNGRFACLVAAAVVYVVGVLGVTAAGNVPLNNALVRFDLNKGSARDVANCRSMYERRWNAWNNIRALACVTSLVLVVVASIL